MKQSYIKLFLLLSVLICQGFGLVKAQKDLFTQAAENTELLQTLSSTFEKKYQQEIKSLPAENKKAISEIYKTRWEYVKEKFASKEVYTYAPAQQYLDSMVKEIAKANPLLQGKDFHCFFSRSGIANASYVGEGIILFNMGLFCKLTNESQAAFVLCHELSHFYLHHSENSIARYVATLNSDEVQKELHKIKKSEYGKRLEIEKLLKGLTFDTRRHGRDHESQADSMAVELLRHTRFDISESLATLSILDSIDRDTLDITVALQDLFDSKEYPFQKRWIAKEEGLLGGHAVLKKDELLADSLKTHPDCKLRIKILEPLVEKYYSDASSKNVISQSKFYELINTFRYEIIGYAFASEDYTESLYHIIKLSQSQPSDPYLITQAGKIFNGFYDAQKSHTLGKVIELPSPFFSYNYNLLLQFIQNLYLEDFANISFYLLKKHEANLQSFTVFKEAYNKSKQILHQQ